MSRPGYDEVVLLTGFPSFAARKMCEELVRPRDAARPRTFVHAIVPAARKDEARALLDELPLEQRQRVNVLEGDASALDLGLSGKELRELAGEVDRIHHLAKVTSPGVDERRARDVNLGGAREILEVASLCSSLKCLVFHSTALVSGTRTGLVLEADLDKGQEYRNVVEETLARAERTMRAAMERLPICVVRPTIIVGDAQTGEVDRSGGFYYLVLLIATSPPDLALPLVGRGDSFLNLVPVDYVVRAAAALGRDPRAPGRTFHVGDPAPLTARRVFELVAAAGGRRTARSHIPANLTKALLRTPGIERFAKSPRAFLDALATPVTYSFANTTELLSDTDVRCPPFESYVESLVEHVQTRLRERKAQREVEDEALDPLA